MLTLHGHTGRLRDLAFSPDGLALASVAGRGQTVWLWDLTQPGQRLLLRGHRTRVNAVTFSPSGKLLASFEQHGSVRLWELPSGRFRGPMLRSGMYGHRCLGFSPESDLLAAGGYDLPRGYHVNLWKVDDPTQVVELQGGRWWGVSSLAFAPDGRTLATGGGDGAILLWDLLIHRVQTTLRHLARHVNQLTYSPDGRFLAATAGWRVAIWDVPALGRGRMIQGKHDGQVTGLAFSPDNRRLFSASLDGTVKAWEPETGRELAAYHWDVGRLWAVALAPDGQRVAAGGDGDIVIWDLD